MTSCSGSLFLYMQMHLVSFFVLLLHLRRYLPFEQSLKKRIIMTSWNGMLACVSQAWHGGTIRPYQVYSDRKKKLCYYKNVLQ